MARSFLLIKENDFQIYNEDLILHADSLVIDVYDASCIFANYNKLSSFLDKIKEKNIKLYLRIDTKNLSRCYEALNYSLGDYISGFYIEDPSPRNLRLLNLKAREYELSNKLAYESLDFVVVINSARHVNRLKRIVRQNRVAFIIQEDIKKADMDYVSKKIKDLSFEYNKIIIDKEQVSYDINKLASINEAYTPSMKDIDEALAFLNELRFAFGKKKKALLKSRSLNSTYFLLDMASRLNLVSGVPIIYYRKRRKKEKILKKPLIIKKFYTVGEEIANAVTHGIGTGLAIAGLVLLMVKGGTTKEILAYLAFSVSALFLYLSSTLYHALSLGNLAKHVFNKLDHMNIYLLIAGSYTPFSLLAIGGRLGSIICILLWAGALLGILFNLFAFGKFRLFHMILYVILGWIAVFFMADIISSLSNIGLLLLIGGGLFYTIGIFFYSLKLFKFSHMVWHIFTLLGTISHFFAIFYFL